MALLLLKLISNIKTCNFGEEKEKMTAIGFQPGTFGTGSQKSTLRLNIYKCQNIYHLCERVIDVSPSWAYLENSF